MNEVTCDNCSEDFKIKLRIKKHGVAIQESYFTCPHCKAKYIAFVTDQECRKMQRDIAKARKSKNQIGADLANEKISEEEYVERIDAVEDEMKAIQSDLEQRMNNLKLEYS